MKILMRPFWMILLFVICLSSCKSPEREEPAGPYGYNENILRFDVAAPFTAIDPTEIRASGSSVIYPLLFSYLCVPDEHGELQPDLAQSWSYDPKTYTWTIELRPDAFFHNRLPVTSEDVEYSLRKSLKQVRPSLFEMIDHIFLVSDRSLNIFLKQNDSAFLQKIWDMDVLCSSSKAEIDYYHCPIGSGPFRFQSRDGENRVVLTANPDYYQDRPFLDGVVFYYQPDKEKSWARLLAGETDIAQEISPKNYEMIKSYEEAFFFDHYTLEYYTILLYNTRDPLFSDSNVRLALTHAIDRHYIVDHILKGYGKVAASPMGADSPFNNPEIQPIPNDPEKAIRLLKSVGWHYNEKDRHLVRNGRVFEFTMLVSKESQIEKVVARYIQLCLSDIGVSVRVKILPIDEMHKQYHRNDAFEAVLTELTGVYIQPEFFLDLWSPASGAGSEVGGFSHPELTHILRNIYDAPTPVLKKAYLCQADALIASLQPGTFLFHKAALDIMSRRFFLPHTFSLSHPGIHRLRKARLAQQEAPAW